MTTDAQATTRFAPQQLAGAAIYASLFILPTSYGWLYLLKKMGLGDFGASLTSALLVSGGLWLFFVLTFVLQPMPASVRPKILAMLGDPALSTGAKLKATFTNWFSLIPIACQLLWIASMVLP